MFKDRAVVLQNEMKGDKMARRSSFGNMVRRKFSDITNSRSQPESPPVVPDRLPPDPIAKECIDQLVKEKKAMMKLIQEKNKILELSGIEIQKLRTCFQNMQLQNWNLAHSNSLMLAELNLGREKLKALQHDVLCKDALLKAKNVELKDHVEMYVQNTELQDNNAVKEHDMMVCGESGFTKDSNRNDAIRGRSARSQSLGSSVGSQPVEKDAIGIKRRRLRRKPSGSRIQHQDPTTDILLDIDYVMFPTAASNSPYRGGEPRMCVGRPIRRTTENIRSYKEKPINVKMRRIGTTCD